MCRSIEALETQAAQQAALEATIKARKEEQQTQIKKMLINGRTPKAIADFCGYPMDQILQVQSSMNQPS